MQAEAEIAVDDLIYDREPLKEIQGTFPRAKLNVIWDEINQHRIQVHIPGCTKEEWYEYLLRSGWGSCSLAFQLAMHEDTKTLMDILARIKSERED